MQIENKIIKNVQSKVNFKGSCIEKLLETMPETKVSKGLRQIDVNMFKSYVSSMEYRMGITADEIAGLKKFDGEDFW